MILVTGAGGFIGSHFVNYLKDKGHKVRATGRNQNRFLEMKADEWITADLMGILDCLELTKGIDEVYHFAANVGGINYLKNEQAQVLRKNITMDINMLEASRINEVKKFFYSSAANVYPKKVTDNSIYLPLSEELCYPVDPYGSYGWGKAITQKACEFYHKSYGMETRIGILFSVYGPEIEFMGDKTIALTAICRNVALAKDKVEIWGEGKEYRCFCFITDVMEGIYRLMQSDYPYPMNIGNEEAISILDLTKKIIKISNKNLEIILKPTESKGAKGIKCDCTKAHDILHWYPKISIDEGLKITYNWILENSNKRS